MEVCDALPNFFWACAHIIRKVICALQIAKGDGHRDAVDIVLCLLNRFIRDQIEICPFWKAAAHQAVLVFNKTFFLRFACMRVVTLTTDDGFKEWPVRKLHPVVHRQSVHAQANENRDNRPRSLLRSLCLQSPEVYFPGRAVYDIKKETFVSFAADKICLIIPEALAIVGLSASPLNALEMAISDL